MPSSAMIASSSFDIFFTLTKSRVQIALQIIIFNSFRMTITFLTTDNRIVTISLILAFITLLSCYSWRANTFSRFVFAQSSFRTVTRSAIGKAEISSFAKIATSTNNVFFALTLPSELLAFKT